MKYILFSREKTIESWQQTCQVLLNAERDGKITIEEEERRDIQAIAATKETGEVQAFDFRELFEEIKHPHNYPHNAIQRLIIAGHADKCIYRHNDTEISFFPHRDGNTEPINLNVELWDKKQ